jgi:hypothetical protein
LAAIIVTTAVAVFFVLTFVAWRRYFWAAESEPLEKADTSPYSLTDVFSEHHLANVPHQKGIKWLTEVFSRSAERFPDLPALQIPYTGESLTFAELDARAEDIAAALSAYLTGPDQVVGGGHVAGQLANRRISSWHSQGRRRLDVPRHHLARRADHSHAQ